VQEEFECVRLSPPRTASLRSRFSGLPSSRTAVEADPLFAGGERRQRAVDD
jgi:hypothetical protein